LWVNTLLTYDSVMSTLTVNTRRAKREDSEAIAAVHDQSWQNAYSGMVPHTALNRMVQRRGAAWWATAIDRHTVILVLEIKGKLVGYATIGRNRVKTLPFDGEVYELYLLPEYQGVGLGAHLFLSAMSELKRRSLKGTVVWVLAENLPAIKFYQNAGGRQIAQGKETFDGKDLKKLAFAWD
jgi:ribosomal protein S18 acetylase RimI-like enzyme